MMRNIFADDWFDRGMAQGKTEGIAIGERRGVAQGIIQGAHDKAVETARALLSLGDAIEKIAKATGLPIAEVQALAQK